MNSLVTGASGFLGGHLVDRLNTQGHRVTAVSRRERAPTDVEWRLCDLDDPGAIRRMFDEVHPVEVFHLASLVTGARDSAAVLPTFAASVVTAVNIMAAALEAGCKRVVLAGSMEELPTAEPARYPYAAAKRAATEYGRFFHRAYGLSVVTARIGMVYGPGLHRTNELVPHVVLSQLAGRAPKLTTGKRRLDWVYVDDVAEALIAMADTPGLGGEVLEIGTGHGTAVVDVGRRITALTGGPEPVLGAIPDRSADVDLVMKADRATRMLGWRAKVGLDEGLRHTVEWYRAQREVGRFVTVE